MLVSLCISCELCHYQHALTLLARFVTPRAVYEDLMMLPSFSPIPKLSVVLWVSSTFCCSFRADYGRVNSKSWQDFPRVQPLFRNTAWSTNMLMTRCAFRGVCIVWVVPLPTRSYNAGKICYFSFCVAPYKALRMLPSFSPSPKLSGRVTLQGDNILLNYQLQILLPFTQASWMALVSNIQSSCSL